MLKESAVASTGHFLCLNPIFDDGRLWGGAPAAGFLPANTCCANRSSCSAPRMGAPLFSAILSSALENRFLMNETAERVLRAVSPQRLQALAAVIARFKTTSET